MAAAVELRQHLDDLRPFALAEPWIVVCQVPVQQRVELVVGGDRQYFVKARTAVELHDDRRNRDPKAADLDFDHAASPAARRKPDR